jgi:hypothetical protein
MANDTAGYQCMQEEHGLAAVRTEDRVRLWRNRVRGCGCWVSVLGVKVYSGWQALAERAQTSTPGGSEEAIVADLHEVMGQHMLQETMDELSCPQGTTLFRAGLGVGIAEGHAVRFQLEELVVTQGDPENVKRQILQSLHAFPGATRHTTRYASPPWSRSRLCTRAAHPAWAQANRATPLSHIPGQ